MSSNSAADGSNPVSQDPQRQLDQLKAKLSAADARIRQLSQQNLELRQKLTTMETEQVEYLQNVSHQLVAPLNAIKWHIENLTEGRYSDIQRINKVLRSIYAQSTISVHLAKNFALMSDLGADHQLTNLREPPEPESLIQLLVNLADDFQPLGWDNDIHVTVIDQPLKDAPKVLVSKNLIRQVFSNIIENAIKYSKPNTEIRVSGNYDLRSKTVMINISNVGIPLPTEQLELIFNRGYRTQQAKNVYPAGTGYGLFIAKRIVDIHKGTIAAFTEKSGRTVFTITLPIDPLAKG